MLGSLRSGSIERRRVGAGAKDISQVPVQWGVHEDVFCAVCCHYFTFPALLSRDMYILFGCRDVPVKCKSHDHLQCQFIRAIRMHWAWKEGLPASHEFEVSVDAGQ